MGDVHMTADVIKIPKAKKPRSIVIDEAVALRAHQTQKFGGVDLANIAEMLGYSDDPIPML